MASHSASRTSCGTGYSRFNWKRLESGRTTTGAHAFRRFRDTYLKNYTSMPPGIINFRLGWAGEGMLDLYDKIRHDVAFRKKVAEKAGLGRFLSEREILRKRTAPRNVSCDSRNNDSYRKAMIGSTRVARRAGNKHAAAQATRQKKSPSFWSRKGWCSGKLENGK